MLSYFGFKGEESASIIFFSTIITLLIYGFQGELLDSLNFLYFISIISILIIYISPIKLVITQLNKEYIANKFDLNIQAVEKLEFYKSYQDMISPVISLIYIILGLLGFAGIILFRGIKILHLPSIFNFDSPNLPLIAVIGFEITIFLSILRTYVRSALSCVITGLKKLRNWSIEHNGKWYYLLLQVLIGIVLVIAPPIVNYFVHKTSLKFYSAFVLHILSLLVLVLIWKLAIKWITMRNYVYYFSIYEKFREPKLELKLKVFETPGWDNIFAYDLIEERMGILNDLKTILDNKDFKEFEIRTKQFITHKASYEVKTTIEKVLYIIPYSNNKNQSNVLSKVYHNDDINIPDLYPWRNYLEWNPSIEEMKNREITCLFTDIYYYYKSGGILAYPESYSILQNISELKNLLEEDTNKHNLSILESLVYSNKRPKYRGPIAMKEESPIAIEDLNLKWFDPDKLLLPELGLESKIIFQVLKSLKHNSGSHTGPNPKIEINFTKKNNENHIFFDNLSIDYNLEGYNLTLASQDLMNYLLQMKFIDLMNSHSAKKSNIKKIDAKYNNLSENILNNLLPINDFFRLTNSKFKENCLKFMDIENILAQYDKELRGKVFNILQEKSQQSTYSLLLDPQDDYDNFFKMTNELVRQITEIIVNVEELSVKIFDQSILLPISKTTSVK